RRDRQRRGRTLREMPDGELALDLEPDDEEEHGQERIVYPLAQRQLERGTAEREPERRFPERLEGLGKPRVRYRDRDDGRDEQKSAGRRRPGGEAERGDAHLVAER